jgi:thioredoxin-related protein
MNKYRIPIPAFVGALIVTMLTVPALAADVKMRDDGIHFQSWIKNISFLDIKEDLNEALGSKKKGLIVIFEQPGCGSCKRLHEVNFSDTNLVKLITQNFDVLQINMYGSNEVTDIEGKVINERVFAEKLAINFTPTTVFFDESAKEIFRIPGYLRPKFYQRAIEYVIDRGPQRKILFPRWSRDRLKKKGADKGA